MGPDFHCPRLSLSLLTALSAPRAKGAKDCVLHPDPGAPAPLTCFFRFTLELPGLRIKQMVFSFPLDLGCAFVCVCMFTSRSPVQIDWEWAGAPQPKERRKCGKGLWAERRKGVLKAPHSRLCGPG